MDRRSALRRGSGPAGALGLALGLALGACGPSDPNDPNGPSDGGAPPTRAPDVVLIVVDTLRADRLSAYGYERPTSPFLDARAAEGVLFEDVTAQSSWTLPSMVSLWTGHYLTAYRDLIGRGVPTLPQAFQRAGYRTVGLAANVLLTEQAGFGRGFDHYDPSPAPRKPDGPVHSRTLEQLAGDLWAPLEDALRTDADGARPPLFLYLQPFDPHDPYAPHPEYDGELPPTAAPRPEPAGWQEVEFTRRGPPANGAGAWSAAEKRERAFRRLRNRRGLYDQEVRHTDRQLELVWQRLEELGVLDHAVVAVVADHGEGLWQHVANKPEAKLREAPPEEFFYQKHGGHLYAEAIATPFLLWGAGVPHGVRVPDPVENVDIFPTLLELAGIAPLKGLHGRDLLPLVRGEEESQRFAVYSYVLHGVTVRELETGLKLIVHFDPSGTNPHPPELYDLSVDPLERTNLWSADSEDATRLQRMLDIWTYRYPTRSSAGMPMDPEQAKRLEDLGYTGEHTGR